MPSLSYKVNNSPVILPFLQVLDRKVSQLRSAKSTTEADREHGSAALSPDRLDVCGVQYCSSLFEAEPIAKSYSDFFCALHAADTGRQLGLSRPISAASYASLRTAANRKLIVDEAK